jgi:hypothetical protein
LISCCIKNFSPRLISYILYIHTFFVPFVFYISFPSPNNLITKTKNKYKVHQTLRFPYNVVDKLPKLSNDIKCEIRSSCPSIITDGSHPFQCYWVNFQSNYLEVIVDAHFRTKPVGDAYYENRQRCLQAIDRAVKMNDIPSYSGSG